MPSVVLDTNVLYEADTLDTQLGWAAWSILVAVTQEEGICLVLNREISAEYHRCQERTRFLKRWFVEAKRRLVFVTGSVPSRQRTALIKAGFHEADLCFVAAAFEANKCHPRPIVVIFAGDAANWELARGILDAEGVLLVHVSDASHAIRAYRETAASDEG